MAISRYKLELTAQSYHAEALKHGKGVLKTGLFPEPDCLEVGTCAVGASNKRRIYEKSVSRKDREPRKRSEATLLLLCGTEASVAHTQERGYPPY